MRTTKQHLNIVSGRCKSCSSHSLSKRGKVLTCLIGIMLTLMAGKGMAQNVNIPNAIFKNYLLAQLAINTVNDGEISVAEAAAFTGAINVSSLGINDLTGIASFTTLTQLNCASNSLTSLDVSANTALTQLYCNNNSLTTLNVSANTALTYLLCRNNSLTSIDVSANTALTQLLCEYNSLTSLDVLANTALTNLYCRNNSLTSLDVSANTALTYLLCGNNSLTSLDVSANPALTQLYCNNNSLTSLDVSANTELTSLNCANNSLTSLNVSANPALFILGCGGNSLTSLDLSANTELTDLLCSDNSLTSLNVQNGNNANLTMFADNGNANLTCIQVDNVANANAYTDVTFYKDAGASYSTNCSPPCTINIPDASFKTYLLAQSAINTNNDNEIQCSEAAAFTGAINVSNLGINDLTGLASFTALTELACINNSLTSLDVSANTALTSLDCGNNSLTGLDVSANTALTFLFCSNNSLTGLDVSANTALTALFCSNNSLTSIDVSANAALTQLYCNNNSLTSLDVSANTALIYLFCNNNSLTSLDVSANTTLSYMECHDNSLTSLNIANGGNNANYYLNATSNPNLTCIQVDNVANANSYNGVTFNKDAGASYSTNCPPPCTVNIPNATFKNYLLAEASINTNSDGEIQCSEAAAFNGNINISDLGINDLTGIEAFTLLTELNCEQNSLTSLDVSAITALTNLYCNNNSLTSINVSANTALINLYCYGNGLTSLDVSANTALTNLYCYSNSITSLDVSANTALTTLDCHNNGLTSLDVSVNTALYILHCWNNSLTSLDVSANTALTTLDCQDNSLTTLNVSANTALTNLDLENNSLTSLDVSANTALTNLDLKNNSLTSLDVSANTALINLYCNNNSLTSLDVPASAALSELYCNNNSLTSLDVSANTQLALLLCNNNSLTSLNIANSADNYYYYYDAKSNPNLTCIQVTNVANANAYDGTIFNKDAGASYSTNCTTTWYLDADNDGYYVSTTQSVNSPAAGYTSTLPANGLGDCNDNDANVYALPTASTITAGGATTFCAGGVVTLSGNNGGVWSTGATTPTISVTTSGTYLVTTTNACGNTASNSIVVSVTPITVNTTTIEACDSYTWPVNGQTYTTSGTHTVNPVNLYATVFYNSLGGLTSAVTSAGYTLSATETFESLSEGFTSNLTGNFGPSSPTWQATSPSGLYTFFEGGSMRLSTNNPGEPLTISFSPGVTSVGANFFITTYALNIVSGTITLTLSDGSTQFFEVNSANGFGGFVSYNAYITSIAISTSNDFVTMDNLVVSTGTIIPACVSEVLNLTINQVPTASTITAGGTTTFCSGGSVTLSGNNGGVWSTGATSATINVIANGDYYVTNTNSCGSVESNHILVNVNQNPSPVITGAANFCTNNSANLNAGSGFTSYLWNNGSAAQNFLITQPGSYSVTVTNASNCSAFASIVISPCASTVPETRLRSIDCGKINLVPSAQIACNIVSGASNYEWEFRSISTNAVYATKITSSYNISPGIVTPTLQWNTQYNCRVRAKVGGVWGNFGTSCLIGLMQNPAITGVPATTIKPQFCNVTNLALTTTIACQSVSMWSLYQYEFTDVSTNQVITKQLASIYLVLNTVSPALLPGHTYQVKVRGYVYNTWSAWSAACSMGISSGISAREISISTDAEGNETIVENEITMDASINESIFNLSVYPNPFNQQATLFIQSSKNDKAQVQIFDMVGNLVWNEQINTNTNVSIGNDFATGTYIIKVLNESGEQAIQRMIKTN